MNRIRFFKAVIVVIAIAAYLFIASFFPGAAP
jgi:hypothetical protein